MEDTFLLELERVQLVEKSYCCPEKKKSNNKPLANWNCIVFIVVATER